MTNKLSKWFFLMLAALSLANNAAARVVKLADGWKVQTSAKIESTGAVLSSPAVDTREWLPATVPSTIMGILTANGVEPEAVNAADFERIDKRQFDVSWWYRTTFTLPRLRKGEHAILSFDGISYRANVWLNGHQIANIEQMMGTFRQFNLDITPYVGQSNVLAVEVFRARPGEPNIGFVDWNPRPADESMGIFREVRVKTCGRVSVEHTAVRSKVNTETLQEAWLTIETELTNYSSKSVKGVLRGTVEGQLLSRDVTLKPYERRIVTLASDVHKEKPRLWWCHNMGQPALYELQAEFMEGNTVSDSEKIHFGIREIQSFLTEEGYRGFTLNGRNVLIRGAGWTDDIYLRDTPASNLLQLEYVRDMNLNTVRLEGFWGTSQNFYDLCDELGILILVGWSCHWEWEDYLGAPCDERYGGITSPEMIGLIGRSFEDQVLWLRHHPSVIGWFVGSDMLPKPELELRYRQFLSKHDDRPYVVSAKEMNSTVSGLSGTKMAGPYEYVSPTYWYDPHAPGGAFGFNTETGIGAQLPVKESLRKMIGGQLFPVDKRWDFLCTASGSAMNSLSKLTEVIDARFGPSSDIDGYLHRADLLNYESTRAMFEAFRVNIPRTTGIIQWMLNSARPGIYWQLYDRYMQPNAAYYAVKRGNAPVQLIYDYRRQCVFAVNETLEPVTMKAVMRLADERGDMCQDTLLRVASGAVVKAFDVHPGDVPASFLFLKAIGENGSELASNDYFLPAGRDVYDWEKSNWTTTPISRYADYRALDSLPKAVCSLSSRRIDGNPCPHYEITLSNLSSAVAFFLRLSAKNEEGDLIVPSFWSDNYLSLAPGDSCVIICDLSSIDKETSVSFSVDGWNLK